MHTSTKLRRINSRNPTTATAPNFLLDPLTAKQVEAGMKELTADDLEEIWLQIHAGNNCFPAADLLRRFVGLCDSEQEFEIQESNKVCSWCCELHFPCFPILSTMLIDTLQPESGPGKSIQSQDLPNEPAEFQTSPSHQDRTPRISFAYRIRAYVSRSRIP